MPIGIKDLFANLIWIPKIHKDHYPVADAVSVALMRQAGGIILGQTVTTEFVSFKSGPTTNPHNFKHTPHKRLLKQLNRSCGRFYGSLQLIAGLWATNQVLARLYSRLLC
ncbi:MAG TPA: hypothetical protein DCW35_08805 [Polynucleobacter sp.]|nr:hypothetical protein [Polynucleobacter sp.]